MSNQLITDMSSMMVALQIVFNIITAVALGSLVIYLIGIILLCMSDRQKRSAKPAQTKPAAVYSPDMPVPSSIRTSTAMRI